MVADREITRLGGLLDSMNPDCELCSAPGGALLWEDGFCRVVLVDDGDYPGFCRVILRQHCKEMTDLSVPERQRLMSVVFGVEQVLRETLRPDKMNIASFGNMVPHVHWHVVPRWRHDRHYPAPIWGSAQRTSAVLPTVSAHWLRDELAKMLSAGKES